MLVLGPVGSGCPLEHPGLPHPILGGLQRGAAELPARFAACLPPNPKLSCLTPKRCGVHAPPAPQSGRCHLLLLSPPSEEKPPSRWGQAQEVLGSSSPCLSAGPGAPGITQLVPGPQGGTQPAWGRGDPTTGTLWDTRPWPRGLAPRLLEFCHELRQRKRVPCPPVPCPRCPRQSGATRT